MNAVQETNNPALELLASFQLESGHRWGEIAQPWQWDFAARALDPSSPVRNFYATRPRGGSKTTDVGGIMLAVMLTQAPPGAQLYALAADRDQARLLLDSVEGFVRRTPGLDRLVAVSAWKAVVTATGVTLHVLAADAPGAWGLRPYFVAMDEFAQWPETPRTLELFHAMRTATGKLNARLVVMTTAGSPEHFAAEVRAHARTDPLWILHEVPGPLSWIPPDWLAEQERALPASVFRRLHLNEWVESEDKLASLTDLRACITHQGPLAARKDRVYVLGLDVGLVHDRTALAICHAERIIAPDDTVGGRRIVVDDVIVWEGTRQKPVQLLSVRETIEAKAREYRVDRVVFDPYQAVGLAQELQQRGHVIMAQFNFTTQSVAALASTLVMLIRNRQLGLPDDSALLDELARVRLIESGPNLVRLAHRPGDHDDRATAIALAAFYLLNRPDPDRAMVRMLDGR